MSALPDLSRRVVLAGMGALCATPNAENVSWVRLIEAPSNLGLRPPRPGCEPGVWRAPAALRSTGLHRAIRPASTISLPRPLYRFEPQSGTRIRNGIEIRRFSEELGSAVSDALNARTFPLVVGGDCSVLLGCLFGARAAGRIGLLHIDGHSDFYHPENYDAASRLGAAAGMDLALATGRGEPLLALWDGRALVEDAHVVQIGERDELEPDFDYRDIEATPIRRFPIRKVLSAGIQATIARALAPVDGERRPLWLHLDLDVLDARSLPAVDSPGSPGLIFEELALLLAGLLCSGRVFGMNVGIYDPELDQDGRYGQLIVAWLARGLAPILNIEGPGE
jgi:arginase